VHRTGGSRVRLRRPPARVRIRRHRRRRHGRRGQQLRQGQKITMEFTNPTLFSGQASRMPESRYILPTFEERTAYGYKRQDPYAKLFEDRIIFLGLQIDDASADDIMAQLLVLESQDPDRD